MFLEVQSQINRRDFMKNYLRFGVLLGITFFALFCQAGQQRQPARIPGNTHANPMLQQDTERTIFTQYMLAKMKKNPKYRPCLELKTVDAKNISGPDNATQTSWTNWRERWTISGCGETAAFDVIYESDGAGGSYIKTNPAN
jgi:hypothetical protein